MQIIKNTIKRNFKLICWLGLLCVGLPKLNLVTWAEEQTNTPASLAIANQLINDARSLESASVQLITRANALRKQVNELRVASRIIDSKAVKKQLNAAANRLAEQISLWQRQGTDNRKRSHRYLQYGRQLLTAEFKQQWQSTIKLEGEIALMPSNQQVAGHNTQIRSVHPSMPKTMQQENKPGAGMTLSVPSMGAQSVPTPLDTDTYQLSRDLHFFTHIEPVIKSDIQQPRVPLNKIHQWHLIVSDLAGQPVSNKEIVIRGHMPGHVHGLPTQPKVTTEIKPGVYLVEGMKFQMLGWWVIEFDIPHQGKMDTLKFNVVL